MSFLGFREFLQRKLVAVLCALFVLLVCAWLMRPVERPAWQLVRQGQVETSLSDIEGSFGQGLIAGTLGGFRTVLADFAWLQLYHIWTTKERAQLQAMIRLVTTLDPRPEFFWIGAARMLAYDVPAWRINEEGGYFELSKDRQKVIDREQAEQAFALLHRALAFHPDSSKLHLEIGQIYMNRLKDYAQAADWYLKASECPEAPYFAARVYAELLLRQGKAVEGYEFLKRHHGTLDDAPYPQQNIVYDRILYFEELLEVPDSLRFQPESSSL